MADDRKVADETPSSRVDIRYLRVVQHLHANFVSAKAVIGVHQGPFAAAEKEGVGPATG